MESRSTGRPGPRRSKSLGSTPVKSKDRKNSSVGLGIQSRRKGVIRKQKKVEHDRKQLLQKKMKFKLGGNKIDPLNLMGLEMDGSFSPKVDSPLSDRGHKFEPGDVRPVDVTDPLKLNNLEDDVLNVKAHGHKRKRKRKRRHTLTEADMEMDKSAGEEILNSSASVAAKDPETVIPVAEKEKEDVMEIESPEKKPSISDEKSDSEVKVESQVEQKLCDETDITEKNSSKNEENKVTILKHTPNKKKHGDKSNKKKNQNCQDTHKPPNKPQNDAPNTKNCQFREKNSKYKYGNYNRYYGYRNANMCEDERIDNFQRDWFEGKSCLDIGCNVGHLTLYIARHFNPRSLLGVDIDEKLIRSARNNIRNYLPTKNPQAPAQSEFPISFALCHGPLAAPLLPDTEGKSFGFPYNVAFKTENYVDCDWSDLESIKQEYDFILCLSVTKWVHLNWGDDGLKKMFKKIFSSLKPDGKLLLEPQPWKSYNKKKNITQSIRETFDTLKFKPDQFIQYLLSPEVGFAKSELLGIPKHKAQGFRRPIYLLTKGGCSTSEMKTDSQGHNDAKKKSME